MLRLALRNLMRNKRRSIITLFSITVSAALITWMRFMGFGMHQDMIDLAVRLSTGYLQIAAYGFNESGSMERAMDFTEDLNNKMKKAGVTLWSPRIQGGALLTYKSSTKFIFVTAIDPEKEYKITDLHTRIKYGKALETMNSDQRINDKKEVKYHDVVIGYRLAEALDAEVGSEISLISSQFDGSVGAVLGRVIGIFKANHNQIDSTQIYMKLDSGRELFAPDDPDQGIVRYTNLIINADSVKESYKLYNKLNELLPTPVTKELPEESDIYKPVILGWQELNRDLVEYITLDNIGNELTFSFLILIMAFGVLATVEMSIHERNREFGIMMAVGTETGWIIRLVMLEVIILLIIGLALGILIAIALGYYFYYNPIVFGEGAYAELIEEMGAISTIRTLVDLGEIYIAVLSLGIPSVILSWLATRQIRKMKPLEVINIQ